MRRRLNSILWSIGALFLSAVFVCCGRADERQVRDSDEVATVSDWTESANQWADSVMKRMSLEEMVGQLFMPASYAATDYWTIRQLVRYVADSNVGGVLFLQGDTLSQRVLSDTLRKISQVPLFVAMDAEWGLGMRLKDAPTYPMNGRLGKTSDDQLMYEYGYEVARQSRLLGINVILGPVLDVVGYRGAGSIGSRSFGSDPQKVAHLAVAYARGLEDGRVMSVGKHFPGHGSAVGDSHDMLPTVERSVAYLDSVDFRPFREYVAAGLSSIMVGHLYVPSIDEVHRSSAISPVVTTEYLKQRIGFDGLIMTDAINMKGATGSDRLSLEALKAGADIVIAPENTSKDIAIVVGSVLNGEVSVEFLREKCRRVLLYKYRFALPKTTDASQQITDSIRDADLRRRMSQSPSH